MADLGFTIGAITDNSISWEKDGVSFFIASTKLTREEMMEVASSMSAGNDEIDGTLLDGSKRTTVKILVYQL